MRDPLGSPTRAEVDGKIGGFTNQVAEYRTDVAKYMATATETIDRLAEEVDELRGGSQGFANMALRRITELEEQLADLEAKTIRGRARRFAAWFRETDRRFEAWLVTAVEQVDASVGPRP